MLGSHDGRFPACSESRVESGAGLPDSVVDNVAGRCDIPYDWIVYSPGTHVFAIDRFPAGEPLPDGNLMPAGLV